MSNTNLEKLQQNLILSKKLSRSVKQLNFATIGTTGYSSSAKTRKSLKNFEQMAHDTRIDQDSDFHYQTTGCAYPMAYA